MSRGTIFIIVLSAFIFLTLIIVVFSLFSKRITINKYIRKYKKISKKKLLYRGKSYRAKNRGNIGEHIVEKIIQKYTNVYYSNVILPGKKEGFYSEMDYIIPAGNKLELIEVKAWYGKIGVNPEKSSKVLVEFVNPQRKHVIHERDNPHLTMSFYRSDLIRYLKKHGINISKDNIKKTIVFTRDESDISQLKEEYEGHKTNFFHLSEFEEYMSNLKSNGALDNQTLEYNFPSWDKLYDLKRNKWFDVLLKNKEILFKEKTILASDIEALLTLNDDLVLVKFRNSKVKKLHLNTESLNYNVPELFNKTKMGFFYFNEALHRNS